MNIEEETKPLILINIYTNQDLYTIKFNRCKDSDESELLRKELSNLQFIIDLAAAREFDCDNYPLSDENNIAIDKKAIVINLDLTHIANTEE